MQAKSHIGQSKIPEGWWFGTASPLPEAAIPNHKENEPKAEKPLDGSDLLEAEEAAEAKPVDKHPKKVDPIQPERFSRRLAARAESESSDEEIQLHPLWKKVAGDKTVLGEKHRPNHTKPSKRKKPSLSEEASSERRLKRRHPARKQQQTTVENLKVDKREGRSSKRQRRPSFKIAPDSDHAVKEYRDAHAAMKRDRCVAPPFRLSVFLVCMYLVSGVHCDCFNRSFLCLKTFRKSNGVAVWSSKNELPGVYRAST